APTTRLRNGGRPSWSDALLHYGKPCRGQKRRVVAAAPATIDKQQPGRAPPPPTRRWRGGPPRHPSRKSTTQCSSLLPAQRAPSWTPHLGPHRLRETCLFVPIEP